MKIDDLTKFQNEAPTPEPQSKKQKKPLRPTPEKKPRVENKKMKEIEKESMTIVVKYDSQTGKGERRLAQRSKAERSAGGVRLSRPNISAPGRFLL